MSKQDMWIQLIIQLGLPLALELMKLFEAKGDNVTAADILGLHAKYGALTANDYLKEAARKAAEPSPVIPSP